MRSTPHEQPTSLIRKSFAPAIFMMLLSLILSLTANAQMPWAPDYQTALRVAKETDRLVLLHFWNDGCPPCAKMEAEVFPRQDVAEAISRDFVPVSIRSSDAPSLIRQFEISGVPSDVALNADGQFLAKSTGGVDAQTYIARWRIVAQRYEQLLVERQQAATSPPSSPNRETLREYSTVPRQTAPPAGMGAPLMPTGQPPALAELNEGAALNNPGIGTPATPTPHPVYTTYGNEGAPAVPAQGVASTDSTPSVAPSPLPHALDGFCAVALHEHEQWVVGDPRWTTTYQGRSYIFSSPQALQRFQASPEGFAPAASGIDIVLHAQQAGPTPGERRYGVWCDDQIFLFANPDSLRAFQENPSYYIEYVRQIESAAAGS
jgi:thioredoxin-related protein/YHS domain-containing protein